MNCVTAWLYTLAYTVGDSRVTACCLLLPVGPIPALVSFPGTVCGGARRRLQLLVNGRVRT